VANEAKTASNFSASLDSSLHPFAPLDVDFAVIVTELSGPVQGSGSGRIGAYVHHAGIMDGAMHLGLVVHEPGHVLLITDPAETAGDRSLLKPLAVTVER
jgi:hypothetical protein